MKKLICSALALVFSSTLLLTACNDPDDVNSETSEILTSSEDGRYVAEIPERNYNNKTFTFLTCGVQNKHESEIVFNTYTNGGEELMSAVVNEAIATRNNAVEEKLKIKIKEQYVFDAQRKKGELCQKIKNDIAAGSGDYYAVVPCIYDGATLAAEGSLYDLLSDVPYLKMSQPWWDQTFNQELTINDKLYFTVGDLGVYNKSATSVLMFNKELIKQYGLENPYELVNNNKWTMDKVFSMAKEISSDDNQDGKIDYKDSMGWSGQLDDMWCLFYGSGSKISSVASSGFPELTMYNDRSVNVLDKMVSFVQDDNHYISANDYFNEATWPVKELTIKPFLTGKCLFFSAGISSTDLLGDMEDDFGIVPLPLFDDTQQKYHSLINPWTSTCFAVPISVAQEDLEFVGIVLEAMGAESRNYVHEAYYNKALKYQKTRDEESTKMLDVIFESRGCDIGMIYAWGGLDIVLQQLAYQSAGTFTSTYEAKEDMAQNALDTTVDYYKNLK